MFWRLVSKIRRDRPQLTVMEGTGLSGGLALIVCRILFGRRYVVSSGDAIGPWVAGRIRLLGPLFGLYERVLCRLADGFIGWTPYLAGRALTFGAPRAMTAAGWAPFVRTKEEQESDRARTRLTLGIPSDNLVIGIVGSLSWSNRYKYCYGRELVEAALLVKRPDVTFLIVGDGEGRARLEERVRDLPENRVVFTGRVPQAELPCYYAAMDIGSLPQSVDGVGSFRYTTKLSEYLRFGLPVVTGQIPLAYDLDSGWLWRLPGDAPWDNRYILGLAELISNLRVDEVQLKRAAVPSELQEFDYPTQAARTERFIRDILKSEAGA